MAITEDQRHELYEGLIQVLGRERATTLMEHLPPLGWADVATKRDLDHQTLVTRRDLEVEAGKLRAEIAELRTEMRAEIAELRTEMRAEIAGVRADLGAEIAELRTEMRAGFGAVRAEIAGVEVRFERALREQSRTFFLGMLTANATLAGLAFAAAQLA